MIEKLSIKNFKSIKDLEIDCKRVNLFIGEPNAGKSNILEALGVISWCSYGGELKKYVRFHGIQNLFFDNLLDKSIDIKIRKQNGKDKISQDSGINIFLRDAISSIGALDMMRQNNLGLGLTIPVIESSINTSDPSMGFSSIKTGDN